MAIALALIISTLVLRWQRFGQSVYPIADALAKRRTAQPVLMGVLALGVSVLVIMLSGWWLTRAWPLALGLPGQTVLATAVLVLLFAGPRLRADERADDPPAQAERLARSVRRYFVPLPLIALGGPVGLVVLWWLRFAAFPGRAWLNTRLNVWTARLVSVHFSLARQSRQSLQWAMVSDGQGPQSLYGWCLQWLIRTQEEMTFQQLWQTLVSLRWQWLILAALISLWLR